MNQTIIQVPVSKILREQAAAAATRMGFSSLQESIRVFLTKLAQKELTISFLPKEVALSGKAMRRYNRMIAEIEKGKVKLFKAQSVEALMDHLVS